MTRWPLTLALTGLLLSPVGAITACDSEFGDEDPFSYVQPADTVIFGEYGHSPKIEPSPKASGAGGWGHAKARAQAFVSKLTMKEKTHMVSGQAGPCVGNIPPIERLGFTGLCLQDGPMAIREADYASVFPAGVTVASSWDKKRLYERGLAMGEEFRGKGANIALSPVCGPLGRSAYSGRNWEGFAADPYLTGVAMEETVSGMQHAGVQATPKHYIGNEQELMRNPSTTQDAYSSNIDDRTIHELYLWPFANAVHAGAASIMCSYNRLNGSYGCQNSKTLNGLLKEELGFQGFVMSDWGATHSGVASINAGLDMDMPGGLGFTTSNPSYFGGNITAAVKNGTLSASRVDDMIVRIMTPYYALGQDKGFPSVDPSSAPLNFFPQDDWEFTYNMHEPSNRDVRKDHAKLIREIGAESTILLKNKKGALPLKSPKVIAVFGNDITEPTTGYYIQSDFDYGTLASGGGSGTGRFTSIVTPLDALKAKAAQTGAIVQPYINNTLVSTSDVSTLWIPKDPDVCIVFLKTFASEGYDRSYLSFDWQGDDMVESVASECSNTVVVTHSAGINILPWAVHKNVTAILLAHYPGEQSGNSIIDVLYGETNPSGHLPYTIAYDGDDYNAPPVTNVTSSGKEDWQVWYDEKLEIDYRYFDAHNIDVQYEFGYGLSYTSFDVKSLKTSWTARKLSSKPSHKAIQPGGNPDLWDTVVKAIVKVSNTGRVDGAAVPQLYVRFPKSTPKGTPPKQLRGFEKVFLKAGESKQVTFEVMRRDVSYWDIISQQWVIPKGEFKFKAGFSSRDLPLEMPVTLIK